MAGRVAPRLVTLILALATLVVGHNLVFLLTYGSGYAAALVATGHDARWTEAVAVALAQAGVLAAVAAFGLVRLSLEARRLDPSGRLADQVVRPAFRGVFLRHWRRIGLLALSLYVVQENVERASVGLPMPGIDVLFANRAVGIAVFAAISLLVALVAALFTWGRAVLVARIAAARARPVHARPIAHRHPGLGARRPAASILGRNRAWRGPPLTARA